jgi:hypothetical protein
VIVNKLLAMQIAVGTTAPGKLASVLSSMLETESASILLSKPVHQPEASRSCNTDGRHVDKR